MKIIKNLFLVLPTFLLATCIDLNGPSQTYKITGTIYQTCDYDQVLANQEIILYYPDQKKELAQATTDENGYFELEYEYNRIPLEPFEIRGKIMFGYSTISVVPGKQNIENFDFVLNNEGKLDIYLDFQESYTEQDTFLKV